MRRLLSILLLCLFGLPLASPLFALGQTTPESRLPACCRRGGDHHCMGGMSQQDMADSHASPNPRFSLSAVHCPYAPGTVVSFHPDLMVALAPSANLASPVAQPLVALRNAAMRRIARDRSCPKRGPPALA